MNGWIYPRLAPQDVTVVICTFERPEHVRRSLLSLAMQTGLPEGFEVVVTDDGSSDETADVVADFARTANFPIAWTSHPHDGFQVARTRNDGVRFARGRYLLLLDGDCVVPPNHLAQHLAFRRPGMVASGDCCRLDVEASDCVTDAVIASGEYVAWAPASERKRLRRRHLRAQFYSWIGHSRKPALIGNNVGCWRADYERINGYDENYRDWGCEDDDFGLRLRWAGCRVRSILGKTWAYHLWHPPHPSVPARWRDCKNTSYFLSRPQEGWCVNGLVKSSENISSHPAFHKPGRPAADRNADNHRPPNGHEADREEPERDEHGREKLVLDRRSRCERDSDARALAALTLANSAEE